MTDGWNVVERLDTTQSRNRSRHTASTEALNVWRDGSLVSCPGVLEERYRRDCLSLSLTLPSTRWPHVLLCANMLRHEPPTVLGRGPANT